MTALTAKETEAFLGINMPRVLHRHLKARAALEGRSMKSVIIQALGEYVSEHDLAARAELLDVLVENEKPHSGS